MKRKASDYSLRVHISGDAWFTHEHGRVPCSSESFDAMKTFMQKVRPTPNPYRPSTNILRRQCAFLLDTAPVSSYKFGQDQDSFRVSSDVPSLITDVLSFSKGEGYEYDLVQANYYEHGGVGISPHQDNEPCIDLSVPIMSISFMERATEARPFSFYTTQNQRLLDVHLGHGDVLVMGQGIQEHVKHGVEKDRPNFYGPRINLTLRKTKENRSGV